MCVGMKTKQSLKTNDFIGDRPLICSKATCETSTDLMGWKANVLFTIAHQSGDNSHHTDKFDK